MSKKSIVIIGSRFPFPLEKGDKLRLYYQIKALSDIYDVHLISLTEKDITPKHIEPISKLCKRLYTYKIPVWKRIVNVGLAFLKGNSIQLAYFYNKDTAGQITQQINKIQPEFIFCQLIRASEYVKDIPGIKILDYMDTFSLGMLRRANKSNFFLKLIFKNESIKIAKYELDVFSYFDKTCIISKQDREKINHPKNDLIEILPNGVDVSYFNQNKKAEAKHDIGFIGNLGYFPNQVAVDYLLNKILQRKNYTLLIAGARVDKSLKNINKSNVNVLGWVDDIRTAYADVKIFVAPLFSGIGQQNKILEAMAMGIPCITTSMVNKAILAKPNSDILIADTPEEFQMQIEKLLINKELRKEISENARKFVINTYNWDFFYLQMQELVNNTKKH